MDVRKFLVAVVGLLSFSVSAQEMFNEKQLIKNLKVLSADSLQGRKTAMPGNLMAAKYVKAQFKNAGIEPMGNDYELPFQFKTKTETVSGVNLIGQIKAKGKSNQYIVISAHYDHVGVRADKVFNGTDDNASGTSALFAIAEYLKQNPPNHNVIIAAFDAEEMGLQGAKAFVKNPPVEASKIILNINMDMIARADINELVACGTFYNPKLKSYLEKVSPIGNIKIVYGHDDPSKFTGKDNWTFSSDHGPFHTAKIPFIYFGVADHADYHQPSDDFEKVDLTKYISCVKLIINSFAEIDKGLK